VHDRGLLAEAHEEARRVIAADPLLEFPEHRPLRALAEDAAGEGCVLGGAG